MNEESYQELLKNAPPHESEEFIAYLKKHNKVITQTRDWLIIENVKHNTIHRPWYTAFPLVVGRYGITDGKT